MKLFETIVAWKVGFTNQQQDDQMSNSIISSHKRLTEMHRRGRRDATRPLV